ncbi:MAG: hypothetical protein AVDCRST_MAG93-5339, partial [uncultured Chloroflexia bacterium]
SHYSSPWRNGSWKRPCRSTRPHLHTYRH